MATMDIIKMNGGEPANFLDVGGGVTEEQVFHAFRIVAEGIYWYNLFTSITLIIILIIDPKAKAIFVNIFGGIVNCATIAKGLVAAAKQLKINKPVVVRLQGTNVLEARKILQEYGPPFTMINDLDEAAKKVVSTLSA